MTYRNPSVGSDIDSYCSRCKLDLAHVLVSTLDGRPAKVQCKTCGSLHKHRGGSSTPTPATKRASSAVGARTKSTTRKPAADSPEAMLAASAHQVAQTYSTKATFKKGDALAHPTFGRGVVIKTIAPNKIDVMFSSGIRTLIANIA